MKITKEDLVSAIDAVSDKYIIESAFIDKSKIETDDETPVIAVKPSKKRKSVKKILLLAAIIAAISLLFSVMPAIGNDDMELKLRPEIYEVVMVKSEHGMSLFGFDITLYTRMNPEIQFIEEEMLLIAEKYSSSDYELVEKLNKEGIDDVLLPEMMLHDWNLETFETHVKSEIHVRTDLVLSSETGSCEVEISYTPICEDSASEHDKHSGITRAESMIVNGIDVIIYQHGEDAPIKMEYKTVIPVGESHERRTGYRLNFDNTFTFEQVLEIAKSLSF